MSKRAVDNSIYEKYGDRWYSAFDDPVALLRAESKIKLSWVLEQLTALGTARTAAVLDVGCGAGFLSNALAAEGFAVTGLDISAESLAVARRHDATKKVNYIARDALKLPFADATFDVVTSMDFLEHIEQPHSAIQEMARVLKPGGSFFFHTFNRNWLSRLVVIKFVEWFVKNTPKDMHVIELFLKPEEVAQFCKQCGMEVKALTGIRPRFSTIPLRNLFSGIVPELLQFQLTKSTRLSYLGRAEKKL